MNGRHFIAGVRRREARGRQPFRYQMLVMTHMGNLVGHDSPVFHLERCQDCGLFDRYLWHLNELWQAARPAELGDRQPPE